MTIPFSQVKPASLKMKVLPRFPANVNGGTGISIGKENGTYTVDIDFGEFAPSSSVLPDAAHLTALLWNEQSKQYVLSPISLLGSGGGIADAPINGLQYSRQSGAWARFTSVPSILDFGAVPNDNSMGTVNAAAIVAALTSKQTAFVPDGLTFYTETVNVPVNATGIYGQGTLIASGTQTGAVIKAISNTAKLKIDGVRVVSDPVAYPTNDAILVQSSTDVLIQNCNVSAGRCGIEATSACTGVRIYNNKVTGYGVIGVFVVSDDVIVSHNTVSGGSAGSSHAIQACGDRMIINHNRCDSMKHFGISISDVNVAAGIHSTNFVVQGNILTNCTVEGINVSNGAQGLISGNTVIGGSSVDFGISIYGVETTSPLGFVQDCKVSGNIVINPGKAGIALAERVFRTVVDNNYIFGANSLNLATDDGTSGVLLYGGGGVNNNNNVTGNYIIDPSSHLKWLVSESNFSGSSPSANFFGQNLGSVPTTALYKAASSTVVSWDDGRQWTAYTPTVTVSGGTATGTGRYKLIGKALHIQVKITVTAGGASSTITLPAGMTSASDQNIVGRENQNQGDAWIGVVGSSSSTISPTTYANVAVLATGDILALSGVIEVA